MRKTLFAVFYLLLSLIIARAQETEDWLTVRSICAEESRELIEVTIAPAITEVSIIPSNPQSNAISWYPDNASRRFWITDGSASIYISAFYAGGNATAFTYHLGRAESCEQTAAPSEPVNECLGIPVEDFFAAIAYQPQETGFVVDGLFYSFHDTLSFMVSVDIVWSWDLYVDNRRVLSFEQTEAEPCHVTAIYPQITE